MHFATSKEHSTFTLLHTNLAYEFTYLKASTAMVDSSEIRRFVCYFESYSSHILSIGHRLMMADVIVASYSVKFKLLHDFYCIMIPISVGVLGQVSRCPVLH